MREQKGITLIALVITIIVLLILAGVSIAMLTGDNGILTQAKEAETKTDKAGMIEKVDVELQALYTYISIGKTIDNTYIEAANTRIGVAALSLEAQSQKVSVTSAVGNGIITTNAGISGKTITTLKSKNP